MRPFSTLIAAISIAAIMPTSSQAQIAGFVVEPPDGAIIDSADAPLNVSAQAEFGTLGSIYCEIKIRERWTGTVVFHEFNWIDPLDPDIHNVLFYWVGPDGFSPAPLAVGTGRSYRVDVWFDDPITNDSFQDVSYFTVHNFP